METEFIIGDTVVMYIYTITGDLKHGESYVLKKKKSMSESIVYTRFKDGREGIIVQTTSNTYCWYLKDEYGSIIDSGEEVKYSNASRIVDSFFDD